MATVRTAARWLAAGLGLAGFSLSATALADKVAVLPFSGTNSAASKADLTAARSATQAAVAKRGHTQPSSSEMLTAEMAVKDGMADTTDEFRAAGRASTSQWAVSARVEPHGSSFRIELEACQVKSGRVESLAREVDTSRAVDQIAEVLAILLRPEGIANADITWSRSAPPLPADASPAAAPEPTPPPPAPAPVQPPAPKASFYGEGLPWTVSIGLPLLAAFVRPDNARGTATALFFGGGVGRAIPGVPGLEARVEGFGSIAGPGAFIIDAGARYGRILEPRLGIYAGPQVMLGAFSTLGGDKTTRFFARGSAFAGIALTEKAMLELSLDLAVAPGGSGTLAFAGGGAYGVVRF